MGCYLGRSLVGSPGQILEGLRVAVVGQPFLLPAGN